MNKPYKAKSLKGAQRRVRDLTAQVKHLNEVLGVWMERTKEYREHCRTLAKLAADGPAFDNPLKIYEAKNLRDTVLRECNLKPDGSHL